MLLPNFALILVMIFSMDSTGQNITGEYFLKANHEMVSAFKFNDNGRFEFFYIYGAVDRMAKGSYSVSNKIITIKADKIPGNDFSIKLQTISGTGTTVKIVDKNTYLNRNVMCVFIKGNKNETVYSNEEGTAHSELTDCDTIYAMHTLYPDVASAIKTGGPNKNNYFELTLNPSMAEVSFKDFYLTCEPGTLTGSFPFLFETKQSTFIKR